MKLIFKKINWGLIFILLLAAFVRFGGLTWCFPYNPHPDEWNMAAAITRLNWRVSLDPKFYAYGQFPLYLSYFSAVIYNLIPWIKIKAVNAQEAIFFLRFWSALAGTATVYLVYLISKKLILTPTSQPTSHFPLLTSVLAAFTPGLIQISHFGTTESLLSFFFLLILFLSFKILESPKWEYYIFSGIVFGLALSTKISALIFGFPILLVFLIQLIQLFKKKNKLKNSAVLLSKNLVLLVLLILLVLLSSPFLLLASKESRGTLLYETSVAAGQSQVFYTRQFVDTKPIIFHLQKIFPYALGWPIFILGSFGFIFFFLSLLPQKVKFSNRLISLYPNILISFSFLIYFLSQAFLFCKWTRFMSPIFAFFPIFAGIFLNFVFFKIKNHFISLYLCIFMSTLAILPGIIFSSIYFRPDIRFAASDWIYQNIPSGSRVLFDTGNVVDIPILSPNHPNTPNLPNYHLVSFDFYHLDENTELFPKLLNYLENSDYIFVPSRRIFKNSMRFPQRFPKTNRYYELLFSGQLGFTETKVFRPYPQISSASWRIKFQIDDEQGEETFSVFDHPTIRIYKKGAFLTKNQYEELF